MKHMIENRCGRRRDVAFDVMIYYRGTPVATARCINISCCGMFIETGPLTFFRNTPLEIEFMIDAEHRSNKYRSQVIVKNSTNRGIGVILMNTIMPRLIEQQISQCSQ